MTSLSLGLAISLDTPLLDLPPPPAPVSLITVDGFPTLDNVILGAAGITFTLAGTSSFAGDHVIDPAEQTQTATGPVNEVLPALTGTPGTGEELICDGGLWAFDPDEGVPSYTFQWHRDGVDIAGATARTYTQTLADAGTALSCSVTASQPVGARTASSADMSVPGVAMLERVGVDFYHDNTAGTEGTVTVDLSAYGAGDTILIFTGPGEYVAQGNLTLDGVAATKISSDQSGNTGARNSAFTITLSGSGSANAQIQTLNGSMTNFRAFAVYALRAYAVTGVSHDFRNSGSAPLSTSLTVTAPGNAVLSCVVGLTWDATTWVAVSEDETEALSGESLGTARALNVPTGTIQPEVSTNAAGRAALISVLLEVN